MFAKDRFLEYLQLPRRIAYINPKYIQDEQRRRFVANLGQSFKGTPLAAVRNDEPLVRALLLHYFTDEDTYDPYLPLIETTYLKHVFAEAKVVNGLGNPEQWASLLSPTAYQNLKQRVDLDFAVRNKKRFKVAESVSLDVHVKNVSKLLVKVFHINTESFSRQNLREVNTDIELDGLVPNQELTYEYAVPPLRRIKRHFEFPELTKPGVYVIDFIGNGKSSRAVIRKGSIRHIVRSTSIGQVVTVLDENGQQVNDAYIWYGGAEYRPNKQGHILLPFTTEQPKNATYVIHHGGQAFVKKFATLPESFRLKAAFVVNREMLQSREQATVLIRPHLTVNGLPVSVQRLEDVQLTITSTDRDGVSSTDVVGDLEFEDDQETAYDFQVPSRLSALQFTLTAKVKQVTKGDAPLSLAASHGFQVNQIEATSQIGDAHLAWISGRHLIALLGRSGEPLADRAVHVELKHRDFKQPIRANLQTDANGVVQLGELQDIVWVKANSAGEKGQVRHWWLDGDHATYPSVLHGCVDETLEVASLEVPELDRNDVSLFEIRGGQVVADQFEHLRIQDGMLQLKGLAPGDYELNIKRASRTIRVRVTQGPKTTGVGVGQTRMLEVSQPVPGIASIKWEDETLRLKIANADETTRVHVLSTHFQPAFSGYSQFAALRGLLPLHASVRPRRSLYSGERTIGDEYDYILRRQAATKFPGNMLERPSLLLNPWALRSTDTSNQDAKGGEKFQPAADAVPPASAAPKSESTSGRSGQLADFATLNWLQASALLHNLKVDDNGELSIPTKELGGGQHLRLVIVQGHDVLQKSVSLPALTRTVRDLRLANGFNPDAHFIQQKQIAVIDEGKSFTLRAVRFSSL